MQLTFDQETELNANAYYHSEYPETMLEKITMKQDKYTYGAKKEKDNQINKDWRRMRMRILRVHGNRAFGASSGDEKEVVGKELEKERNIRLMVRGSNTMES